MLTFKMLSFLFVSPIEQFLQPKIDAVLGLKKSRDVLSGEDREFLFKLTTYLFEPAQYTRQDLVPTREKLCELMELLFLKGDFRSIASAALANQFESVLEHKDGDVTYFQPRGKSSVSRRLKEYLPNHRGREILLRLPGSAKPESTKGLKLSDGKFADFYESFHGQRYIDMLRNMRDSMAHYEPKHGGGIGFILDEKADTFLTPTIVQMIAYSNTVLHSIFNKIRAGEKGKFVPMWILSGHHAKPGGAEGFCPLNHTMALHVALQKLKGEVGFGGAHSLVTDLDIHGCVGLPDPDDEELEQFGKMPKYTLDVTTVEQFPFFYGSEFLDGKDYCVLKGDSGRWRIVMAPKLPKGRYVEIVKEVSSQIPRIPCLIVSNGFDTRIGDPTANHDGSVGQNLTSVDFHDLGTLIGVAQYDCVVVFHEGGYKIPGKDVQELVKSRNAFFTGLTVGKSEALARKRDMGGDGDPSSLHAKKKVRIAPGLQERFNDFVGEQDVGALKMACKTVNLAKLKVGEHVAVPFVLDDEPFFGGEGDREGIYAAEVTRAGEGSVDLYFPADDTTHTLAYASRDLQVYDWPTAKRYIYQCHYNKSHHGLPVQAISDPAHLCVV